MKGQRTRERILARARQTFAEKGFAAASVRSIATSAGVDQALVHRYFGTKQELFLTATELPVTIGSAMAKVLELPVDQLGTGLVEAAVRMWDSDASEALVSRAKSILTSSDAGPTVEDVIFGALLGELPGLIDPEYGYGSQRVALVATQMVGLLITRKVVGIEPIRSMPVEQLSALVGPTIQRYLTGDLGPELENMGQ